LLTVIMVLVILFFGLRPKDFNRLNRIERLKDRAGIQVSKYGLAYGQAPVNSIQDSNHNSAVFSLEMAFKPKSFQDKGFNLILSLHDGQDSDQLIVGQWQSSIIIMNGDDYDHTKRKPRAVISSVSLDPENIFLAIVAGKEETTVYANGMRVKTRNDFVLKYPESDHTLLTLGNSIYGRHPWNGEIYGFALYKGALSEQQVENHVNLWDQKNDFSFVKNENPSTLYLFNEDSGNIVPGYGEQEHHLNIPNRIPVLKREILSPPWKGFKLNSGFISDSAINLLGFIPLGFGLCALWMGQGRATPKQSIVMTVAACFVLSLMIEIVQSWIPSRSSSMLDLILNTGGGLFGSLVANGWRLKG
jgi:hypothetical protein